MKKIPTLLARNPDDMSRVLPDAHPDCQWVVDGEGVATRKLDGTSCMFDGTDWWKRREVKAGKPMPDGFREEAHDEATGKRTGWMPVEDADKWHREAIAVLDGQLVSPGTFELCGPKVQGNPEGLDGHMMLDHASAVQYPDAPTAHDELRDWLDGRDIEGLVWHHPDGRMAKIKLRDFALKRAV